MRRVRVGIGVPDVAQSGSAEHGIRERMQDNVRIAMSNQATRVLDPHPPQNQGAAFRQSMSVMAYAHTHGVLPAEKS